MQAVKKQRTEDAAAASGPVLDQEDWQSLQGYLQTYDEQRESVIKRSRDAQKLAKQAIYSLHWGDYSRAEEQLASVEKVARELLPIIEKEPTLRYGSYAAVMEEYAEAAIFKVFLTEGRMLKASELRELVQVEEYLGGVLDFTGELNRHAVACATRRDVAAVSRCREIVDALMGQFLQFDLRNGALRKKFDSLKYTLKKLESMLYELSLAEATGMKSRNAEPDESEGMDTGNATAD
ncbi:hypothetical protein OEZ86_011908 [Tetradesmus obliquus]|nr:hypothetical protein OEZ86_011908 [Tetradesmus obliquus]